MTTSPNSRHLLRPRHQPCPCTQHAAESSCLSLRIFPMQDNMLRAFAVASSEPLTSSGGPRFSGQQLFTKLSCSAIFFTCGSAICVSTHREATMMLMLG